MTPAPVRPLLLGAALLATTAAGCRPTLEPIILRGEDLGRPVALAPDPGPGAPSLPLVLVEPVTDARGRPAAGVLAGRRVEVTGLEGYLEAALAAPAAAFDAARTGEATPSSRVPALRLRTRILKAYVQTLGSSRSTVVAAEATFVSPDGSASVSLFRAQEVGVRWTDENDAVVRAFQTAARACAEQIRAALPAHLTAAHGP